MPIGEEVAGAFKGPGKKWLLGGAVVGGGYLWYTRVRPGRATAAKGTTAGGVGITTGGQAIDPVATPPGGDYSPAAASSPVTRPATNVEWLAQAVAVLAAPPYNRPTVPTFNALSRALAGEPITTAEGSIVELALTAVGTPPDGMPVLNISSVSAPASNPSAPASNPWVSPDGKTISVGAGANLAAVAGSVGLTPAQFDALNTGLAYNNRNGTAIKGMPYRIK